MEGWRVLSCWRLVMVDVVDCSERCLLRFVMLRYRDE